METDCTTMKFSAVLSVGLLKSCVQSLNSLQLSKHPEMYLDILLKHNKSESNLWKQIKLHLFADPKLAKKRIKISY